MINIYCFVGVNPRSGEGVSPQKGTIPTVGNLRNGSNDGIANVNLRNGMSNVTQYKEIDEEEDRYRKIIGKTEYNR